MTDLEDRIRTALLDRADATAPTRVHIEAVARRRWAAPLLAAAVIVLLAATAVVVANVRTHGDDSPAAGGAFYVGSTWRVVSLHDFDGPLQVPAEIDATITYASNGLVIAHDPANTLSGIYSIGESTYTVGLVRTGRLERPIDNPMLSRLMTAVDKLFFGSSTASPNPGRQKLVIKASGAGDTLVLQTIGTEIITVTLERVGPADLQPSPSATSVTRPYVGVSWRIEEFRRNATTEGGFACATLQFLTEGKLTAHDGVGGTFTGSYTSTPAGFVVRDGVWTGFGVGSNPPLRQVLSELFYGNPDRTGSGSTVAATAQVDGDMLVISYSAGSDDVRIKATRLGPAPDPSASPNLPPGFDDPSAGC